MQRKEIKEFTAESLSIVLDNKKDEPFAIMGNLWMEGWSYIHHYLLADHETVVLVFWRAKQNEQERT